MILVLDSPHYSMDAVQKASTDYAKFMDVEIHPEHDITLHLHIRSDFTDAGERVIDEFLNYVLDLSIREHLENQ